jgi:hypothetical protein
MTATPVEHPGPWRWVRDENDNGYWFDLVDANGAVVLDGPVLRSGDAQPSPGVRALTEAAPEMEALLRRIRDEVLEPLGLRPDIADLLARIDSAGKAGT